MRTIEDILADLQAIIDAADGRSLTDEECGRYEALEGELQQARRSEQIRARNGAYNAPVPGPIAGPVAPAREDTGLEDAFVAFLRTGKPNDDITGLAVTNAQSAGTGSEGGYTVPTGFRQRMVDVMKDFGGIATVAETVTTTTGNPLPWPTINDTSNTGEIVSEGGTHSAGADLTFGVKSLSAYEYQSGGGTNVPLRLSWTLLQDSAFDIVGLITRKLGERIARAQSAHLATGTGASQPLGLVYGLTGIEPADDTKGIVYDDLLTFIHSVDRAYRRNATWVFNDLSLKTIAQIKDSNGDPMWRSMTSTMGDSPYDGMLLDFPYVVDAGMPNISIASNAVNWGAFGDIREGYVVRTVRDIQIVVNPWTRAAYRQTEFTAWARLDATQQNTSAYVAPCGES